MITFGSGVSAASTAAQAAREAALQAREASGDARPKLAVVFTSMSYDDASGAARVVRETLGDVTVVGGGSGACVFGANAIEARGVSVVLLGGDDLEVESRTARLSSNTLVETVPAAEEIARAADAAARRGFTNYACLVFAPGVIVDGEVLVAAVRKGAGARAQLAGALTGDDFVMHRPRVFSGDELRDDCAVVTGIYSRRPIGIAARHGYEAVGPARTVTRADGAFLLELDGRPALDVWVEDARRAGADPPADRRALALYLANHYDLGIADESRSRIPLAEGARELVARAPVAIREDGAVQLSASMAEGTRVRVIHPTASNLLRAANEAATAAATGAGDRVAGALVLACASRLATLGNTAFAEEAAGIRLRVAAPIGGACVYGEIARNIRDADAFFNTTTVVVAFASEA